MERTHEIAAHIVGFDAVALGRGKTACQRLHGLDWDDSLDRSTRISFIASHEWALPPRSRTAARAGSARACK